MRRLGSLEKDVAVIKPEVAGIRALLPHLATKADVVQLPRVESKSDIGDVRQAIRDCKASIIRWAVGTGIAVTALAFITAKILH